MIKDTKNDTYRDVIFRQLKTKDIEKHLKVARGINDI